MKFLISTVFLFMTVSVWAGPSVQQLPLDERTIYEISIEKYAPTTIMFPGKITAISSANITNDPEIEAPIILSYKEGMHFLNVRALTDNAKGAINIIYKNKTYVFSLSGCNEGMRSVSMYESNSDNRGAFGSLTVAPQQLLQILDRAKAYNIFKMQYPSAVQQIERKCPGNITLYKEYDATLEEVYRFDPEDTVVFKIRLHNKSDQDIYYQPQSLAVRVGHNIYYASISDASGIMPAQSETDAYFAVTGKPGGGRAHLSVNNEFNIIVMQVEDISMIIPEKC